MKYVWILWNESYPEPVIVSIHKSELGAGVEREGIIADLAMGGFRNIYTISKHEVRP